MIFHENRLLADRSHEISYLIFLKIGKDVAKFVVGCSGDWRFKGQCTFLILYYLHICSWCLTLIQISITKIGIN